MSGTKVYVGGLRPDINEREVEDEFRRFGKIYKVWIARNPPGFAFIDFEDVRDAEDACRKLNGHLNWKVEISRSRGPGGGGGGRGGGGRDSGCFNCGEPGHMARDCRNPRGGSRGGDRDRGYSPRRSRSPPRRGSPPPRGGRSRSPPRRGSPPPRGGRSRSPPPARGRSPPIRGGGSRSPPPRRSRSRS